jgi:hypothetical protein
MRQGILYTYNHRQPLAQAIAPALLNFTNAPHLAGHHPAEARFNPAQLPADLEVEGLSVLPDERVKVGYVRITTCDMFDDVDELAVLTGRA